MGKHADKGGHTSNCRAMTAPEPGEDGIAEMLSQKGAMALAKRLEHFWHGQGYNAARFWAEPIGERFEKVGSYEIYRVVSNLVNGLPPRYRDDIRM